MASVLASPPWADVALHLGRIGPVSRQAQGRGGFERRPFVSAGGFADHQLIVGEGFKRLQKSAWLVGDDEGATRDGIEQHDSELGDVQAQHPDDRLDSGGGWFHDLPRLRIVCGRASAAHPSQQAGRSRLHRRALMTTGLSALSRYGHGDGRRVPGRPAGDSPVRPTQLRPPATDNPGRRPARTGWRSGIGLGAGVCCDPG